MYVLKDNECLILTQKNLDGALYSTKSMNIFHETVGGYVQNTETAVIVKELTQAEAIELFYNLYNRS
jgi:hypothetical protein